MKRRIPISVTFTRRRGDVGPADIARVYPQASFPLQSDLSIKLTNALIYRQLEESKVELEKGKRELERVREELASRRRP